MSRAIPTILFGDNALAIKADATFSATDIQPFVDLTDLNGEVADNRWITFEPNQWLLDGSYHFLPAAPQVGLMSASMSDAMGDNLSVTITIQFVSDQSITDGITLYFSESTNDYPQELVISCFNSVNTEIFNDTYLVTDSQKFISMTLGGIRKITIELVGTNKPYRFARLLGIDFDTVTRFTDAEIKAARLVEQINPLSVELPYNEVTATLFSSDGDFSIVDPQGVYATFQEHQPLDVWENINGIMEYMGRFYLDEWKSQNENLADIRAVSAIALLDNSQYLQYVPFDGSTGEYGDIVTILHHIFTDVGLEYELDASFSTNVLRGVLDVDSRRVSLQQILFSIGAYATDSRSSVTQIKPIELASDLVSYDHTLTAAQKGISSPVDLKSLVTGVNLLSHTFSLVDVTANPVQYFDVTLPLGEHTVYLSEFINSQETGITGTGVSSSVVEGARYFTITVTTAGTFICTAISYFKDSPKSHSVIVSSENVLTIDGAILVHIADGDTVAQRVYDYHQQRYIQKTKLFGYSIAPGDSALVDTQSNRQIAGIVEKMTTNLIGFVSDVEIVGTVVPL